MAGDSLAQRAQSCSPSPGQATRPQPPHGTPQQQPKATFNPLFALILPSVNLTEFLPHSFSLLESQPEPPLPKRSFLPLGKMFWAQDHLSASKCMVPTTPGEADPHFSTGAHSKRSYQTGLCLQDSPSSIQLHQHEESERKVLWPLLICRGIHSHMGRKVPFCFV